MTRSIFTPFHPAYETVSAARPIAGDVSSLVLKGISGRQIIGLVIINITPGRRMTKQTSSLPKAGFTSLR